jgi:hypothetical protein
MTTEIYEHKHLSSFEGAESPQKKKTKGRRKAKEICKTQGWRMKNVHTLGISIFLCRLSRQFSGRRATRRRNMKD